MPRKCLGVSMAFLWILYDNNCVPHLLGISIVSDLQEIFALSSAAKSPIICKPT